MPIKEAACYECKTVEDLLVRMSEVSNPPPSCPVCSGSRSYLVSAPQKTAGKWGDQTGKFGVNGFYDRGLGATYYNNDQRDRIAKAKGLIPLDAVGGDAFVEKRMTAEMNIKAEQDKILQSYKDKVEQYGGSQQAKVRAIEEILPATDCLGETGAVKTLSANIHTGE